MAVMTLKNTSGLFVANTIEAEAPLDLLILFGPPG